MKYYNTFRVIVSTIYFGFSLGFLAKDAKFCYLDILPQPHKIRYNTLMPQTKLDKLVEILKQAPDEVFIQPHNVPDPDAIASSLGMYYLLSQRGIKKLAIVYDQEIEKANSLLMLEMFNVPIIRAGDAHTLGTEDWAVLIDAQKGNDKNALVLGEKYSYS